MVGLLLGVWLGACGADGDDAEAARSECLSIADAFARAWERCNRMPYDEAYDGWQGTLGCDDARQYDASAVASCIADIDALTCPAVNGNVTPASCKNIGD